MNAATKAATVEEAARWGVMLMCLVFVLMFYTWRTNQDGLQHTETARDDLRETVTELVRQEVVQLNHVLMLSVVRGERAAVVQTDKEGNVVAMNDRARIELRLQVGEPIELCMPDLLRQSHAAHYQAAMLRHQNGHAGIRSQECFAIDPDGNRHRVRVEPFTQLTGGGAFITRL